MVAVSAIKRLMFGMLLLFAAIALAASYWAVAGREGILRRGDNPRLIEAVAGIRRGSIYDNDGQILVKSIESPGGYRRSYLTPSTYSAVGYYSLRYGTSSAEAAFNQALNGTGSTLDLEDYFLREILHLPPEGADIRLTLLTDVQDALVLALGDHRSAAVVMDADSGAILAMASLPTYDPNTLDEDWEKLVADDGKPFFNRALQGLYQPGSVMHTLWLAHALRTGFDMSTTFSESNAPVELEPNWSVSCHFQPAGKGITLIDAFIAGCPAPFLDFHATLSKDSYSQLVDEFWLEASSTLTDFPVPEVGATTTTDPADMTESNTRRARDVLGQGNLTITPLQMATIMSAIASSGSVPAPHILSGIRQPDAADWEAARPEQSTGIVLPPDTAARLRIVFTDAWTNLVDDTVPPEVDVGGNIAKSRSGKEAQLWLSGFVAWDGGRTVAFVVVLENSDDIEVIVAIGQAVIEALLP